MPKVVVAIPTIEVRGDAWRDVAKEWELTPGVIVAPSWRPGSWAAGLNEVYEWHPDADVFVCASDDMAPEGPWLPHVLEHFAKDECPVPTMHDPRMTTIGGTQDVLWKQEPHEGAPAKMSNFPILKGDWLPQVFPLPEDLHYYSDNLISDRLLEAGVPLVTCLDISISHTWDQRGRDESARMVEDRERYQALR